MKYYEVDNMIKRVSVKTLNFLKGLCLWFWLPCMTIGISPEIVGDTIAYYGIGAFTYWAFFALPFYWFLLIIQAIMTAFWNNRDEYFNITNGL